MKQKNATTSTENNEPDSDNDAKILDFVEDIEFPDDIKPKLLVKEEVLKSECSGIDQKPNMINPILPNAEKMMDFVHDIEFSEDMKPKFEIKDEKLRAKGSGKAHKRILNSSELTQILKKLIALCPGRPCIY